MPIKKKTPYEKLETKLSSILVENPDLKKSGKNIKYGRDILLSYSNSQITYSKKRYYKTAEEKIGVLDYKIVILLNDETINLISRTSIKPPQFIQYLIKLFRGITTDSIDQITIGSISNGINQNNLNLTFNLYNTLQRISNEERLDESIRFKSRAAVFVEEAFALKIPVGQHKIDWNARLQEIIASGNLTQQDFIALTQKLDAGDTTKIIIEKQVNKQVEWLLKKMEDILDEENLTKIKAQELGLSIFNYPKTSVTGAEHLMEKILTDYGKNTLFGVPALVNTNKYVLRDGHPRVQFDILLINNFGEVEVIELKKPNTIVLDFDDKRNKFYPSVELSKAIAQTERYLSSIIKDNDDELKIDNQKIRDFLNNQLGGNIHVETLRPRGVIIIGSSKTICLAYEMLPDDLKSKFTRDAYNLNSERAYREIKDSLRNIDIITYSELLESARLRLQQDKES